MQAVGEVGQQSGFSLDERILAFTNTLHRQIDGVREILDHGLTHDTSQHPPQMSRLPKLVDRMRSHMKKSLRNSPITKLVVTFDEFCGELITEIHQLQQLQV